MISKGPGLPTALLPELHRLHISPVLMLLLLQYLCCYSASMDENDAYPAAVPNPNAGAKSGVFKLKPAHSMMQPCCTVVVL